MVKERDFSLKGSIYTHYSGKYQLRERKGRAMEFRLTNGPNIWRSTGKRNIVEAGSYVETFLSNHGMQGATDVTMKEFARDFFVREDVYSYRTYLKGFGYDYPEQYFTKRQSFVDNYIIPQFGDMTLKSITTLQIEMWFTSVKGVRGKDLASDTRASLCLTLSTIMDFALKKQLIPVNPCDKAHKIKREYAERGVFTKEEIQKLFPQDYSELMRVWGYDSLIKLNQKYRGDEVWALKWALYYSIMADTGFRPGEIAALTWQSFIGDCGVYTESSVDSTTKKIKHSIKTTNKGQRYKVGILSDYTLNLLEKYRAVSEAVYLFLVDGGVMTTTTSQKHFEGALKRAGIEANGRTQYCMRHTFDTFMLNNVSNTLSEEDVRLLMGHKNYRKEYDHRTAGDLISKMEGAKNVVNGFRA